MSAISSIDPPVVSCRMNVWDALESSRGLTAVAASWRERLADQCDSFKTAFLQRAPGIPKGMPCSRGCGCTHEIVTSDEWRVSSEEGKRTYASSPSPSGEGRGEGDRDVRQADARHSAEPSTINSPPSTIRAVCRCAPPNCPDIPLTPEDIVLLELSWTKLARSLCCVFALDYKP